MEYSKEFVTAVVLGKDLVPRQVEKWLNFLMNICCSKPKSPFSYQKHLNYICLQFPHLPCVLLTCLPTYLHLLPGHLCWCFTHLFIGISHPVCVKEKGEYDCPISVTVFIVVCDVLLPSSFLPVLSQTSLCSALNSVSCHLVCAVCPQIPVPHLASPLQLPRFWCPGISHLSASHGTCSEQGTGAGAAQPGLSFCLCPVVSPQINGDVSVHTTQRVSNSVEGTC